MHSSRNSYVSKVASFTKSLNINRCAALSLFMPHVPRPTSPRPILTFGAVQNCRRWISRKRTSDRQVSQTENQPQFRERRHAGVAISVHLHLSGPISSGWCQQLILILLGLDRVAGDGDAFSGSQASSCIFEQGMS
jgi:hypothetical protein